MQNNKRKYLENESFEQDDFECGATFIRFENPSFKALLWIQYGDIWCYTILKVRQFDDCIMLIPVNILTFVRLLNSTKADLYIEIVLDVGAV